MKTSESQLRAILKWRSSHKQQYNEKAKVASLKYYHENKEKVLEKKKLYYLKKKMEKEEKEKEKEKINKENEISLEIVEDDIIKENIN